MLLPIRVRYLLSDSYNRKIAIFLHFFISKRKNDGNYDKCCLLNIWHCFALLVYTQIFVLQMLASRQTKTIEILNFTFT